MFLIQEHISLELNPAIQEWMRSVAIRHLNEYINNNNTEESPNTQSYIVTTNLESDNSRPVVNGREEAPKQTDSIDAENVEFSDALTHFDDNLSSNNSSSLQMDASSNDFRFEMPAVVIGSESWHSSVPSDWVRIKTFKGLDFFTNLCL